MVVLPKLPGRFGMGRFVEGESRRERLLLPDCLDDYVGEDNLVVQIKRLVPGFEAPSRP